MRHFLDMAGSRQHRQDSFNQHACVPLTTLAGFEVHWMPIVFLKGSISEHDHFVRQTVDQLLKRRAIVDICCVHIPSDNQTQMVHQEAQFAALICSHNQYIQYSIFRVRVTIEQVGKQGNRVLKNAYDTFYSDNILILSCALVRLLLRSMPRFVI